MNKKKLSEGLLLFIAFIWGATFVVVQEAIDAVPPLTFNAVRFFIAGMAMLFIYCIFEKKKPPFSWKSILSGILLGFCLFIGYSFQTIGLLYTTPSKAGFITGLSVVMVPLISFLIFRKRPTVIALSGTAIAAFGLYLLAVTNTSPFSIGDVYVLICAFGFAFHIVFTDRFAKKVNVIFITTVQIFTVSILCAAGALLSEKWQTLFHPSEIGYLGLASAFALTSLIGTAAAFLIQTISQRYTSPTRVGIILTMEPVFAAVTSYLWVGERLSLSGAIGCIFIFLGMMVIELPGVIKYRSHSRMKEKRSG